MHSVSNPRKEKPSARRVQTKDRSVPVGNHEEKLPEVALFWFDH